MSAQRTLAGAKLRLGFIVVHVFNSVLDVERLLKALQLELAHAAIQLGEHGLQYGIFFGVGAGWLRRCAQASAAKKSRKKSCSGKDRNRTDRVHRASFVADAAASALGMGRIGGLAVPCG